MLTGGCFCGNVRYEVTGAPFDQTNCHCSICRRTSGAAFVTWFSIGRSAFRVVSGTLRHLRSSDHGSRSFCPRCGTPVTFASTRFPDEIDVSTCSLDDPEAVPPRDHTRTSAKLRWIRLADGLPEFQESRSRD